jgi:hypothetical protein
MIVQREQRSPVDEEIRLQNASKVMYGNKDKNKDFPFDVRMRFHYVIYHEALGRTEDGQVFSKVSTRRYSFFTPETWDTKMFPRGQKSWFELQGKNFVILHDPIEQAKKEGVKIKGYYQTKTGLTLAEKLAQAVSAESFVTEDHPVIPVVQEYFTKSPDDLELDPPATVEEFIELEDEETPVQKRAAKRKNVKESEVENG